MWEINIYRHVFCFRRVVFSPNNTQQPRAHRDVYLLLALFVQDAVAAKGTGQIQAPHNTNPNGKESLLFL